MNKWGTYFAALFAVSSIGSLADSPVGKSSDDASGKTVVSATLAAWPVTAAAANRVKEKGVPNFGKLNTNIWRSGQPTSEGYKALAADGLKTVVNLRAEFPQDKDLLPAGVNYVYIPIKDDHEPTVEQAKQFMAVASDPKNWPLLVHCKGGEGRAGVMSALVRYSMDGWDHKMVMQEVGNFRTKHLGFITTPMASCQQNFIQQWEKSTPAKGYIAAAAPSTAAAPNTAAKAESKQSAPGP